MFSSQCECPPLAKRIVDMDHLEGRFCLMGMFHGRWVHLESNEERGRSAPENMWNNPNTFWNSRCSFLHLFTLFLLSLFLACMPLGVEEGVWPCLFDPLIYPFTIMLYAL